MANTPKSCPGWEQFRSLTSVECRCPECGKEKEIFSDQFDREHVCAGCGKLIDFSKCSLGGTTNR